MGWGHLGSSVDGAEKRDKAYAWETPTVIAQREEEELKKHDQVRRGEGSILIDSLTDKVFKGRETDSQWQIFQ